MAAATTYIEIAGDTSKYERSLRDAQLHTQRTLGNIKTAWIAAGAAIAGGLKVAAGIKAMTAGFIEAGLEAERMSRSLAAATGSAFEGAAAQEYLRRESQRLGLVFTDQAQGYAKIAAAAKGTALEGAGVREIWTAMAEAGAALQLTSSEVEGALLAVSQMISKGKVSAEELRGQLGERLPGAFQVAARSMGLTTAQLDEFMSKGKLTAENFLPKFAKAMREQYGDAAASAANTAAAAINEYHNAIAEFEKTMAERLLPTYTRFLKLLSEGIKLNKSAEAIGAGLMLEAGIHMGPDFQAGLEMQSRLQKDLEAGELEASRGWMWRKGPAEQGAPGPGPAPGPSKEMIQLEKDLAAMRLDEYRKIAADELAIWEAKEIDLSEVMQQNWTNRIEQERWYVDETLAMRRWQADASVQYMQDQAAAEVRIEEEKNRMKTQSMINWMQTGMNIMAAVRAFTGKENKVVFALAKGLEVAKATMAAFTAANMALASPPGPPWTIPLSQATLAMGLANAAAIAATAIGEMSAGTQGGAAIPTGAAVGATVPEVSPDVTPVSDVGGRPTVQIIIEGDSINDEEYLERWAEKISEMVESKDVRLYASNSKMAERLT